LSQGQRKIFRQRTARFAACFIDGLVFIGMVNFRLYAPRFSKFTMLCRKPQIVSPLRGLNNKGFLQSNFTPPDQRGFYLYIEGYFVDNIATAPEKT
jgi:hypothetical protein